MMSTPMKAIRAKCLDCCCGNSNEVKLCPCEDCPLHPFRFGKNPNIKKREATPEQRERLRDMAAKSALNRKNNALQSDKKA